MRTTPTLLAAAGLLLSSCASATHTPYTRPPAALPAAFEHASPAAASPARGAPWWRGFGDPSLDALIDLAIARNPDLAAAAVRVRRAGLQARLTGNSLLPVPNGSLDSNYARPLSPGQAATRSSSATVGVTWEADLFGKLAADRDAARFEALATTEDRDAVYLSLIGSAAALHWQIALANERIALGERSLTYAGSTRTLVEAQYRAGAVSALERQEAEQTMTAQEAALSQLRQTRTEAREALVVLLDGARPPGPEPQSLEATTFPTAAAGLPAELLGRRPDLRAAELRLRGVLAQGDATRASFYPALTLTGGLGASSSSLLNLIANPIASLGAGLTLPFLNVRAMRFETAIARTRYEEAVILFRKSLYSALVEVENALAARAELAAQGDSLRRARAAAADAARLYEVRYRAGAVPLRTWLDAQERLRSAELALSGNTLARLQNQAALHQALGDGLGRRL